MRAYVADAHRRGMRVKIYYTVRELTNHAPELFALRSLGDEVIARGPGGGDVVPEPELTSAPGGHEEPAMVHAVVADDPGRDDEQGGHARCQEQDGREQVARTI